jgi:hypothetical protein
MTKGRPQLDQAAVPVSSEGLPSTSWQGASDKNRDQHGRSR